MTNHDHTAMGAELSLVQTTTEGGEARAAVAPATEDAATGYLPMLLLIEGHLQVGVALYREGIGIVDGKVANLHE